MAWWIAIMLGITAALLHWPINERAIQRPLTERSSKTA